MRAPVKRRILTATERGILRSKIAPGPQGIEASDVGASGWYVATHDAHLDPAEVASKKRMIQAQIDAGTPQDEKPAYRRWRDRRIAELEEDLRKDVVPQGFFGLKRSDTKDYDKTVQTLAKQMTDPRRAAKEQELKNLRREREPDDPNAGKIEDLREDRRIQA